MTSDGTPRATERSEGGSKAAAARTKRNAVLTRQFMLRLDEELYAALEQYAKEQERTMAQSARMWLRAFHNAEIATHAHELRRELRREPFEESP